MSELIKTEGETLPQERTADVIAGEIIAINQQVEMVALAGAVEIGRRLCEAKEMIGHGGWMEFLSEKVGFSTSKANNMMRIYKEYGSEQADLLQGNKSDLEIFGKLSVSQAVALFALPAPDRAEFAEENDLENKSVREIQQLIRERDEAQNAQKKAESKLEKEQQKVRKLEAEAEDAQSYKAELDAAEQARQEAEEKAQQLKERISELEAIPIPAESSVLPDEEELEKARAEERAKLEAELSQAKQEAEQAEKRVQEAKNPLAARVSFLFEEFNARYEQMTGALSELREHQPETAEKFLAAIASAITDMQVDLAI